MHERKLFFWASKHGKQPSQYSKSFHKVHLRPLIQSFYLRPECPATIRRLFKPTCFFDSYLLGWCSSRHADGLLLYSPVPRLVPRAIRNDVKLNHPIHQLKIALPTNFQLVHHICGGHNDASHPKLLPFRTWLIRLQSYQHHDCVHWWVLDLQLLSVLCLRRL